LASVAQEASEGSFGKTLEATLGGDDARSMQAFRFAVPAPGAVLVTAKATPQARISVSVYAEGGGASPIAQGEAGKKVEAAKLQPGTYYVAVSEAETAPTRVELRVVYKPQDPDAAQTACKTQAIARELSSDGAPVEDSVSYSDQRRTCYWHLAVGSEGSLALEFEHDGNNLTAEFISPHGKPEKIDPAAGLNKTDLAAGDYYVKVYANDAGDAGKYRLSSRFEPADTCKNGGPACSIAGAEDLKLPFDTRTGEVDARSKQFHFYKATLKEKGKLTLSFKVLQPPRSAKVQAFFMRSPDEDGDRLSGASTTKEIEQPGDYFVRVQAQDPGDFAKYALGTLWSPASLIPADVVEIAHAPCLLTVSAGSNQGVRQGMACAVVSASGQPLDSCAVDQTFPNLSKVKAGNARCNVQLNAKVQIVAQ
jgi:hypothetical protein